MIERMTERRLRTSFEVAAPADQAWALLVDWARHDEWMFGTSVHVTGAGAGARLAARTAFGPVRFTDTMVVTVWEPPRRCLVRHTGRVVRGEGGFEVEP